MLLESLSLDMAKIIEQIYKRENPKGTYLTICIRDEGISINNEYWDEDAYFPINVDNLEGQINHRPVPLDEEDEE